MKTFFKEFGAFIKRGNVLDLAVGVIIGGAFSAIVTALSTHILRPIINWIITVCLGSSSPTAYTILKGSAEDIENAIYIDWGAFISAIINFFLIALILFIIVKIFNRVADELNVNKKMKEVVTEKMKRGEKLKKIEIRWVKRMEKLHPEMVPTLEEKEPEPEPVPEPTPTEKLLMEILEEIKKNKQ